MEKSLEHIAFEGVDKKFTTHLANNCSIFFDGSYGIGKTTYLSKYFEKSDSKDKQDYFVIRVTPVEYDLSHNDDIFNLIKYDILFESAVKHDIKTIQSSNPNKYPNLYKDLMSDVKTKKISAGLIWLTALTGLTGYELPAIYTILNKSLDSIEKLFSSIKEIKDASSGDTSLSKILDKLKERKADLIAPLVEDVIYALKKKYNKKAVLIIDDLDRLYPDYMFRVLNMLSARQSNGQKKGKNLFGFDNIIVVGDYKNIELIYKHKHGPNTNFRGYIDKYFDSKPFQFDTEFEDVASKKIPEKIYNKMLEVSGSKSSANNGFTRKDILSDLINRVLQLGNLGEFDKLNFRMVNSIVGEYESQMNREGLRYPEFFAITIRTLFMYHADQLAAIETIIDQLVPDDRESTDGMDSISRSHNQIIYDMFKSISSKNCVYESHGRICSLKNDNKSEFIYPENNNIGDYTHIAYTRNIKTKRFNNKDTWLYWDKEMRTLRYYFLTADQKEHITPDTETFSTATKDSKQLTTSADFYNLFYSLLYLYLKNYPS